MNLHICTEHEGKMESIPSISTSCLLNPLCKARTESALDVVCKKCYAQRLMAYRGDKFRDVYARNTEILTSDVYSVKEMPLINAGIARFEAFGDLQNAEQALNYFHICKRNPRTTWALWTKNPQFIAEALKDERKPKNLIVVYSEPIIGTFRSMEDVPDFVDKIFMVHRKDEVKDGKLADGSSINCGKKKCIECGICYSKRTTKYIHELLK